MKRPLTTPNVSLLLQKPYLQADKTGGKPLNPKTTRIYAYLILNRDEIVKIKTEHVIKPTEWDFDKQLKKERLAGAIEYNRRLLTLKDKILDRYHELQKNHNGYSFNQIKHILKNGKSIYFVFDEFIEDQKNRLAPRTIQKFNTLKTTLEEFAEARTKYQMLTFSMINHTFMDDFLSHLRAKKLSAETTKKYMDSLGAFLKWAEGKGESNYTTYKEFQAHSFANKEKATKIDVACEATPKMFMRSVEGNLKIWLTQTEGICDKNNIRPTLIKAWNRLIASTNYRKNAGVDVDVKTPDINYWHENVYILRHPMVSTMYKIGITDKFPKRFCNHCTSVGGIPDIVLVLELKRPYDIPAKYLECFLHEFFKDRHVIGEWFELNAEMVNAMRDLFYSLGDTVYGEGEEGGLPPGLRRTFIGPCYVDKKSASEILQ